MMILPEFDLHRPTSVGEAIDAARRASGDFDYLAGGTDLLANYKCGINTRREVISLRHIDELKHRDGSAVGSGVTLGDLERDEEFLHDFPVFRKTLSWIASPLLRQSGTIGGNLLLDTRCIWLNQTELARTALNFCLKADGPECRVVKGSKDHCYANYSGDMAPALMCLDARIRLVGLDGERCIPLRDFFRRDGITRNVKRPEEILVSIEIPSESKELVASYHKLRVREAWDFPELGVAAAARMDGNRIGALHLVANAVASIPLWLDELAAQFVGRELTDETIDDIADAMVREVKPVRATLLPPAYRKQMVGVMTRRCLREIRGDQVVAVGAA